MHIKTAHNQLLYVSDSNESCDEFTKIFQSTEELPHPYRKLKVSDLLGKEVVVDGVVLEKIKKGPLAGLLVQWVHRGRFCLKKNDNYFCAEPNNTNVLPNRCKQGPWELFEITNSVDAQSNQVAAIQAKASGPVFVDKKINGFRIKAVFFAQPKSPIKLFIPDLDSLNPHVLARLKRGVEYLSHIFDDYILTGKFLWDCNKKGILSKNKSYYLELQCGDKSHPIKNSCAYDKKITDTEINLVPDDTFYVSKGFFEFSNWVYTNSRTWESRSDTVFWRGSSSGMGGLTIDNISNLPRYRLCKISSEIGIDTLDAKLTNLTQLKNEVDRQKILEKLRSEDLIDSWIKFEKFADYKYVIEIDGNVSPWNFLQKLMLGSCVLRVESTNEQWFYDKIKPWVHYVPVEADLSDLVPKIEWCKSNENESRKIAQQGQEFAMGMDFKDQMRFAAEQLINAAAIYVDTEGD